MEHLATVVIADDHPLFRKGLVEVVEGDGSFDIVGQAVDGREALALVRRHRPSIALLDIEMPGESGLGVTETIKAEGLEVEVVLLTMHNDPRMLRRALDVGAKGYVLKDAAVTEIVACLHMVSTGRAYISPALSSDLLDWRSDVPTRELEALAKLTPAERRVLRLVARGLTTSDVALDLGNSEKTIENHRSHICRKLGLTGPQALLRFALEHRSLLD